MSHSQSEWEQKTFWDFVSIKRGYDLTRQQRKPGNIPVYGAAGQNGCHNESKVKAPGIIIGRSGGSFGKVHLVSNDFWPHNTAMYVTDFKGNDPSFAYYLLKSLGFSALNSGSAQPSLNRNFLYPVKINVPKPTVQAQIGVLLGNLDKKIELNNKINAELEAMAKLIYDYWFVQFDFPDAFGKPYKSSGGKMVYNEALKREIPDGWGVEALGDIEPNIVTGKTPSTKNPENFNGSVPFICIGDVRGNMHITKSELTLSEVGANSQIKKYIPEGAICVTCIASPGLVGFATENSQTNQQLNTVVCSQLENRYFLYFDLKDYFRFAKAKSGNTFASNSRPWLNPL